MKAIRLFASLLHVFLVTPIWLYLMHTLLAAAHVDRLVWFLFWVYLPLTLFICIILALAQENAK